MTALDPLERAAEQLQAYADEMFERASLGEDVDVQRILFAIEHDGAAGLAVRTYASSREAPVWPHACGMPTERCVACAPHLYAAHPVLAIAPKTLAPIIPAHGEHPFVIVSRYGRERRWMIVAPHHPADRQPGRALRGWQVREGAKPGTQIARVFMARWDAAATPAALHQLACELADIGYDVQLDASRYFDPMAEDIARLDAALVAHAGSHAGPGASIRRAALRAFERDARAVFAADPRVQSVMLCIARYYSDQGLTPVHGRLYASERAVPMWPHPCPREDLPSTAAIELGTERCGWCAKLPHVASDHEAAPIGLGGFCKEGGREDDRPQFSFRPFAIARRGEPIAIDFAGACRSTDAVIGELGDGVGGAAWPGDTRTRELLDQGAAAVLADHLIELGDPRGERLARGAIAMIDPIGRAIVPEGARFAGGLLVHAEVFCADEAIARDVRGAAAWSTVETVRYLAGSCSILAPSMRALREVSGATEADARAIGAAAYRIETLEIALEDARAWATLVPAASVPALRALVIGDKYEMSEDDLAEVIAAPWWGQLARVTVVGGGPHRAYLAARAPVVAWCYRGDDFGRPAGWLTTWYPAERRAEIALAGWQSEATPAALTEAVTEARGFADRVALVASPLFAPTAEDRARAGAD